MKSQARVVVIGGGVVGASVLYHLTKAGWRDVMLLERAELTAGSTWHAAGGMHTINGDPTIAKLQQYTIELYKEIEAISGQSCGVHITGGLMLAGTRERMDWLKMVKARGRYLGMDLDLVSADDAEKMFPLLDKSYFVGALYDPIEGHVDPYGVTHAYARAAQIGGATVERQCRVTGLEQYPDGSWLLRTEKGDIRAEHVVNCGGLWAREVGRMVGLELPVLAMEHHYIITEDIPALAGQPEQLHCVDFEGEIYTRQERGGMLLGTYEKNCVPWSERETPWDFGQNLLPNDLERIAPELEVGFAHFPVFNTVGIRKVVNGPFTFAPDGNPLLGPVRGLRNFWVACGVMAGFSQGGGVGLSLANWITRGDPGFDIWGMDVARYGDWTTLAYTNVKVRENYSRRFRIRYPNEELPAGRPYRTSPIYDRLDANHAVWGDYCGLEHALWFAPSAALATETFTFKRSDAYAFIAAEVKAVREGVGLIETTNYGKFEVTGPKAEAFLNTVMANRMPPVGRMVLTPMLNEAGKLIGDFTVGRWAADKFLVVGTYAAERFYARWFDRFLPDQGCTVRACAMDYAGLAIAGPKSRELLQGLVARDLSTAAFPFMSFARMDVGTVPALVGRVSFTGELGYEIWVKAEYQRALYDLLVVAGEPHGLRLFGGRALNAMRIEKGFGNWAREFRPTYGPDEAGLGRFVSMKKGDFVGRGAVEAARREDGGPLRLITLAVEATDADALGDEPIWHGDKVVGWVTSGGYGPSVESSLALGYVPKALAGETTGFAVEIMGERRPAARVRGRRSIRTGRACGCKREGACQAPDTKAGKDRVPRYVIRAGQRSTDDEPHRASQPGQSLAQKAPPRIVEFEPIPADFTPRRPAPYRLDLADILGVAEVQEMSEAGQMVFHCIGDTGGVKRPEAQMLVASGMERSLDTDKMAPGFCYHLGDVIYYTGEVKEYWPQFYEPYDGYPLKIFGIAGNHDGEKTTRESISLLGYYQNFCAEPGTLTHEARESGREAMIQPWIYWTLITPFATIIGLYTNVPEHGRLDDTQRAWFRGEMRDADPDKALIVALHHPVYSFDKYHSGSSTMAQELQDAINESRRVPNLVLTAHVHNYQRIELRSADFTIPFFVIGNGGYWNLHYLASPPGYQDPETEAKLMQAIDSRHGFMTFAISKKVINGHFTTVPRPQESWSDPNSYNPTFDVFSYSAVPRRLAEGQSVTLVPADGAHLAPATGTGKDTAETFSRRARALQAHRTRTSARLRGASGRKRRGGLV